MSGRVNDCSIVFVLFLYYCVTQLPKGSVQRYIAHGDNPLAFVGYIDQFSSAGESRMSQSIRCGVTLQLTAQNLQKL